MQLAQQPGQFFDQNQFLLANSAYPSNQYTIPAYKGANLLISENVDFNYHLAQPRVQIEHAIGILKGQFASLHEMRSQIRNRHEMKAAIKWIISCAVLHNLLADLKDQWNKLYKEEKPELAPPVGQKNEDTTNDGL
jgi:heme oxygenase